MQEKNNVSVTNVYKDGSKSTTKEKYTQVWIRIIKGRQRGKSGDSFC